MKHTLIVVGLVVAWLASPLVAAEQTAPKVVGIQIAPRNPAKGNLSFIPGRRAGTKVWVTFGRPDKHFVAIDTEASTIEAFTDDKGTSLKPSKQESKWHKPIAGQIGNDAKSCVVSFDVIHTPVAGATSLRLKANVVMKCGEGEESFEHKDLALKTGTEIKAGPVPMKFKRVTRSKMGKIKAYVEVAGESTDERIKAIAFLCPDGKEVPSQFSPARRSRFAGKVRWTRSCRLLAEVDTVTVKVTYFERVEALAVPIDVAAGIGF